MKYIVVFCIFCKKLPFADLLFDYSGPAKVVCILPYLCRRGDIDPAAWIYFRLILFEFFKVNNVRFFW